MKEKILTTIFGKTETGERYTFRQWLVVVWFTLSLALLCSIEDAPLWFYGVMLVNFAFAANKLRKLPLPQDPEDEKDYADEED